MIEMIPVESKNIDSLGYEEESSNLHIKFTHDTSTYYYKGISMNLFVELLYSQDKDEFLKENIFKKYEKIAV